jgi:periplasmic protein CpxP/Spy
MKKVFLILTLVLSLLTFAQEKKGAVEKMSPEQQSILLVKKLTLSLDLNQKQQEEIKALLLEMAQKKAAHQLEKKTKKEKGEKPTATEKFEKQSQLLDDQITFKAKMKKILNEEQFKKWETNQNNRKGKMNRKKEKSTAKQ